MTKCEECGAEAYSDDDTYCRQCGTELPSYNCECGAEIMSDDNFCHSCGSALEGVEEVGSDETKTSFEDDDDENDDDPSHEEEKF